MRLFEDDRAVRNVIGFTLTFSIIIVSVGLVATLGYTQLGAISQSERVENAESGMELIASNFQQLEQQRSTVQTNEIDISGGSLTVVEGPSVTVRSTRNFNETYAVRGLQYSVGDTTFTYENGALFRTGSQGNAVVLSTPSMTCTKHQAVVSVVTIAGNSEMHFGGDVVTVNGTRKSQELLFPMNRTGSDSVGDAEEANVTVSSPRIDAWDRHLNGSGNWSRSDALDDTFVCQGVESVYVRRTVITVRFLS